MGISVFGGGFLFTSFTHSVVEQVNLILPGAGGWSPFVTVSAVTIRGRWLQCQLILPVAAGVYRIRYALGVAGSEVMWQPTGGFPGAFVFGVNAALADPVSLYNFPISLEPGFRLSAQANYDGMPATIANLITCIWG